jgi:chromosome segregation ATPase
MAVRKTAVQQKAEVVAASLEDTAFDAARDLQANAIAAAYKRGQEDAALHLQVAAHENRLNAVNGSIRQTGKDLQELTRAVEGINVSEQIETSVAVALQAQSEKHKQEMADKEKEVADAKGWRVSKLSLILGAIGAFATLGSMLSYLFYVGIL